MLLVDENQSTRKHGSVSFERLIGCDFGAHFSSVQYEAIAPEVECFKMLKQSFLLGSRGVVCAKPSLEMVFIKQ